MISNGEKREAKSEGPQCHYLAVKKLSELLRETTSIHYGDFLVWFVFITLDQKLSLNHIKKLCQNNDFIIL